MIEAVPREYNLPREYISASQLGMYLRCGLQYKYRYIDGISKPPGIAMLQGTAFHETNEQYYQDVIDAKKPFTPEQAAEFSVTCFEEASEEGGLKVQGPVKDVIAAELTHTTEGYITHVAPFIEPISTEEEIRYQTNCGVTLLGYLDLRRRAHPWELAAFPEQTEVLVDYKLGGKKWTANQLENSLQFMLYTIATGVRTVEIHSIVRSAKKPKVSKVTDTQKIAPVVNVASNMALVRHGFNGDEYEHVENLISKVVEGITKGVFMPCDPSGWMCGPKWCGYWDMCRGKGRSRQVA